MCKVFLGRDNPSILLLVTRICSWLYAAGNCSYDFNVPEEINRRIIDHLADFNLVYTEHTRRHLITEGLPHRRIYLTSSAMKKRYWIAT